ncbi:MAG: sulfurtransferase [Alphaproteobacteria bacterium]|nr:sulfurtransferase [Alphaproteobacteria bacterium]
MTDKVVLDPTELSSLLQGDDIVVIDTRAPEAYAAGHIQGAVNIHEIFTYLAMSSEEGMAELRDTFITAFGAAGLSGSETAVLYEESMDTGFGQSCRGYFLLKFLGYKKAAILHGGFKAWSEAGLPVTTDVAKIEPKTFVADPASAAIMVDVDVMLKTLDDPSIVKLDVRDVDEWIGESSSPYGKDFCPRKGRIPGAKWVEWYRFMKPGPDGAVFKSKSEVMAECQTVGITTDTPVVIYCFKGARAANTFMALKDAGIKDVRMYFGSWNEWSRNPDLPIEEGFPAGA